MFMHHNPIEIGKHLFREIDRQFDFWFKRIENDMPPGKHKGQAKRRLMQRQRRFSEAHHVFSSQFPVIKHQPHELREKARDMWVEYYEKWFSTKPLCESDVENSIKREMEAWKKLSDAEKEVRRNFAKNEHRDLFDVESTLEPFL